MCHLELRILSWVESVRIEGVVVDGSVVTDYTIPLSKVRCAKLTHVVVFGNPFAGWR